jgi:hypothetical protein
VRQGSPSKERPHDLSKILLSLQGASLSFGIINTQGQETGQAIIGVSKPGAATRAVSDPLWTEINRCCRDLFEISSDRYYN